MIATANLVLLLLGFILVSMSLYNFTRSFAIWCALFPVVMRLQPLDGVTIPSCRFVTSGLFVIALFKFKESRNQFPRSPFWSTYILFLVLASLSAAISTQPIESLGKTFTYVEPLMWATMAAFCMLSNKDAMRLITRGILCGVAGVTSYAVVELIYQRSFLYDWGLLRAEAEYINEVRFGLSGRVMSTIGQPVGTALYLVSTLPLVLFHSKYLTRFIVTRFVWLLMLAAGLICLIATGTRAGYVAILMVPLAYYIFSTPHRRRLKVLLSTYAVLFLVARYLQPPDFVAYFVDSFNIGVTANNPAAWGMLGRIDLTQRLLEMARDNPWFGIGPGFVPRMAAAGVPNFVGLGGSENQYAMLLVETGIVGTVGYAIFIFSVLHLLVTLRRHRRVVQAQWSALSGSIFVSIMVAASTVTVIASVIMMLMMTYLGMAVVLASEISHSEQARDRGKRVQEAKRRIFSRAGLAQTKWTQAR